MPNDIYTNDVAIIMLNYYPPEIVCRAIASIRNQTYSGTWTLYLGFHHRGRDHKEQVRGYCADLPVHYVDIERDLVFDVRPRDKVLQAALCAGNHRYLFFLDDDDEWYPEYLERMTSFNTPFVTCGKDVYKEDTGEVYTVNDDFDYEGMGFHFGIWRNTHLPYFIKQISDKYILREFQYRYPDHPVISEPLYRIHQHSDSVTFAKSLGRNAYQERILSSVYGVVCKENAGNTYTDCTAIARALGTRMLDPEEFDKGSKTTDILLCQSSLAPRLLKKANILIAIADQPPEAFYGRNPYGNGMADGLKEADGLLLCDPLWIDGYETINPNCLPIGIPSAKEETEIREKFSEAGAVVKNPILYVPGYKGSSNPFIERVIHAVSANCKITDRLEGSSICWLPDMEGTGWGRPILEAFESGIPCITSARNSAAKILYGGSNLLVYSTDPEEAVLKIMHCIQSGCTNDLNISLMLFRRCFGAFYWRNYFTTYLKPVLESKGYTLQ